MASPVDSSFQKLPLFLRTARHLTLAQIGFRARRIIKRQWRKLQGRQAPQPTTWKLADRVPIYSGLAELAHLGAMAGEARASVESAQGVAKNCFCFLNKSVDFGTEPNWRDPGVSKLWRYHLHYFDYTRDLLIWAATGQRSIAYETFRRLADSWINRNQSIEGDGWQPYTISLRLVNWLQALSAFDAKLTADQSFRNKLLSSLYGQSQILYSDLELDLRGNHLIENLRALLWTGVAFEGAEPRRWFGQAMALLRRELAEQVLRDGGHFERSPGYHLVMLRNCLEIGLWLKRNAKDSPVWLDDTLRRMLDYTVAIITSDGRVPLLKDTAWDAAPHAADLLAAGALYLDEPKFKRSEDFGIYPFLLFGRDGQEKFSRWPLDGTQTRSVDLRESGHYVMRDNNSGEYLIFDAGKPCPDYLPAHAHADMLTYELLVDGRPVVVDSGVYEYEPGPWRDYFRSTRAHNTVEVSGQDQSEMWSNFRVARRARPGPVVWQQKDGYALVQGSHDGYRRLAEPVTHRRTIVWRRNQFWLVIDELFGRGQASANNHVHFHPSLALQCLDDSTWRIQGHDSPLWVTAFGEQTQSIAKGQVVPLRQGWYSERFGDLRANTVLTLHRESLLPIFWGYVISRHEPVSLQSGEASVASEVNLTYRGSRFKLRLEEKAAPLFE